MSDLASNEIRNEPRIRHNIKLISVCRNQFFMGNIYIVVVLIINHCDDSSGVIWLHLFEATLQIQSPIYNPPDIQIRDSFKNQFTFFFNLQDWISDLFFPALKISKRTRLNIHISGCVSSQGICTWCYMHPRGHLETHWTKARKGLPAWKKTKRVFLESSCEGRLCESEKIIRKTIC